MSFVKLCLLLFIVLCISIVESKLQNITVKGTAVCNKKRLANVKVTLMEKDTLSPNDILSTVTTDREGEFQISGEESEMFTITPYIVIEHSCNVKQEGCTRETHFEVPKKMVGGVYDMTYVTLDIVQFQDKEKC